MPFLFTVTYGAMHPVSDEEFSRERDVRVVQGFESMGFVPLFAVQVWNEAQLRFEISQGNSR